MLQKKEYTEKNTNERKISEFISKGTALLILSGCTVLKIVKFIHYFKKLWSFISHKVLFIKLTTVTLTLRLKWKSDRRHLSIESYIMLMLVNWFSSIFKRLASSWHEISLKRAIEQTLKHQNSSELLKMSENC